MNIHEKLMNIQVELKAPKNQWSDFGKYHYRSCEDILEGLKPLLIKYKTTLTVDSGIELIGDRYYIKAIATLIDTEKERERITSVAYAREDENKAKMDLSQMTGSASSYARKYALNGLFAIDDTKDSDATNEGDKPKQGQHKQQNKGTLSEGQINRLYAIGKSRDVDRAAIDKSITTQYKKGNAVELTKAEYDELCSRLEALPKKDK